MTPLIKIGFFTDLHARNDTPENRTDDFRESLLKKLSEVGKIFTEEEVDLVLFGGDLAHTPDPSYSLTNALLKELRSWNKEIIGVVGSHDYFGYQKVTLERTLLGAMVASGIMTLVDEEAYHVFKKSSNSTDHIVTITGSRHQYDSTDHPERLTKPQIIEFALLQIQLVHCDLFHKSVPWPHVLISNVTTQSDLVLSGHIHSGWEEPIKINNTTFFNPGSIARLERSKTQRIPRVSIIEIYGEKSFKIKSVYLQTALPHPFKEDTRMVEEDTSQDVSKLLAFIENTVIEITDVKQLLTSFARFQGCKEEILEEMFRLLDKAKL